MNNKKLVSREFSLEVPKVGELLIEFFKYSNGRRGMMCFAENRSFNITLNTDHEEAEFMILKMYDEAEIVNRHLLSKTDMFKKVKVINVGRNFAQLVILNKDYYVNKEDK